MSYNAKTLKPIFNKWVDRLRLKDWTLTLKVVPVAPMDGQPLAGKVDKDSANRLAIISISDGLPSPTSLWHAATGHDGLRMAEQTIIHELFHVLEEPLRNNLAETVDEILGKNSPQSMLLWNAFYRYAEHMANSVSAILLEADRREHDWKDS